MQTPEEPSTEHVLDRQLQELAQPERQLQVNPETVIQHFRQRCADLEFENVKLNVVVQQQREQINSLLSAMNETTVSGETS